MRLARSLTPNTKLVLNAQKTTCALLRCEFNTDVMWAMRQLKDPPPVLNVQKASTAK